MRNYIISTLILSFLFSCTKNKSTKFSGEVINPKSDSVSIYIEKLDTAFYSILNEDNIFSFEFEIDSSSYAGFQHGPEVTKFFINPNDNINLSINTKYFDETVKYEGSEESNYLAWKSLYIEGDTTIYDLKELLIKTEDVSYIYYYNKDILSDKTRFNLLLDSIYSSLYLKLDSLSNRGFIDLETREINNQIERLNQAREIYIKIPKKGEPAINFTAKDLNKKDISLSDFKGSLVYVDIWATWCGPCVYQIPYLKELEKEYHNKDIVFLSVSLDENEEAWKKMVLEKELIGVQLITDKAFDSNIVINYNIGGIPKFMLFDKEGNVISTDAPRPNGDIRELINQYL